MRPAASAVALAALLAAVLLGCPEPPPASETQTPPASKPTSDIRHPSSVIRHPSSVIRHPSSAIRHPTPNLNPTPTPNLNPTPTPNLNPTPTPNLNPTPTPPAAPERVRPAVLAGSWYPSGATALAATVDGFLAKAKVAAELTPTALVAPHAGYRYSGPTAGFTYRAAQQAIAARNVTRVVVLGPSHRVRVRGIALPAATHFETPLGKVPLDTELLAALAAHPLFAVNPAAHAREHSVEIQVPFLQRIMAGREWRLVPLVVGQLDEADVRAAAAALREHITPNTLVVASSDFTHHGPNYGYEPFSGDLAPQIRELDMGAWQRIAARDVSGMFAYERKTGATICGFLPIAVVVALLPEDTKATLLHYDTSGRIVSDFANSVSYVAAAFNSPAGAPAPPGATGPAAAAHPLTSAEKQTLLRLARDTVEAWVRDGRKVDPTSGAYALSPRLREDSGAFVTLNKHGRLRGCIGDILPRRALYQVVRDRAIDAAAHDRRFRPVTPAELEDIEIEVSVLTPPAPVASWQDIVIGRDGVLLQKGRHGAVYLPQVAPEQGWDVPQTLNHLARKAGLPTNGWREGTTFQTFEAIVFEEPRRP